MTPSLNIKYAVSKITRGDFFFFYWKERVPEFDPENPEYRAIFASNYVGTIANDSADGLRIAVANSSESELIFSLTEQQTAQLDLGYHLFEIYSLLGRRVVSTNYLLVTEAAGA